MQIIKLDIFIDRGDINKKLEMEHGAVVSDLLERLGINPVSVIVSRNSELILQDEKLKNNDKIKILSVISGG